MISENNGLARDFGVNLIKLLAGQIRSINLAREIHAALNFELVFLPWRSPSTTSSWYLQYMDHYFDQREFVSTSVCIDVLNNLREKIRRNRKSGSF